MPGAAAVAPGLVRREPVCPFVDRDDPRCAAHLTLRNLPEAFAHCADRYTTCPVYQELITHDDEHLQTVPPRRVCLAT